jgi:hypothetical protein
MLRARVLLQSFVLGISVLAASCGSEPTVEQQIIGVINEMESQVEAAERRAFIAHVAMDFKGQAGAMTRDELNAMVLLQLNQHRRLQAQLGPIAVSSATPGAAEASFHVLLTGGTGWLPETGQAFQVTTRWDKQGDDWQLVEAQWRPVELSLPLN